MPNHRGSGRAFLGARPLFLFSKMTLTQIIFRPCRTELNGCCDLMGRVGPCQTIACITWTPTAGRACRKRFPRAAMKRR